MLTKHRHTPHCHYTCARAPNTPHADEHGPQAQLMTEHGDSEGGDGRGGGEGGWRRRGWRQRVHSEAGSAGSV